MADTTSRQADHHARPLSEPERDLLRRQREVAPTAFELAAKKMQARPPSFDAAARLLRAAERTPRMGKRIRILLQAASAWGEAVAPITPCRQGCSACCHQPVTISSAEARHLASISGRPVAALPHALSVEDYVRRVDLPDTENDDGAAVSPCLFLHAGACSVYEARPIFYRTHFSLSDSDLLCRIVPGHPVDVPYANATRIRAYALLMQPNERLADIRDFFPPPA